LKSGDLSAAFHVYNCDDDADKSFQSGSESYPIEDNQDGAINSSNIGFQMLKKFGWNAKAGLGKSEQGITAPIKATTVDMVGVGIGKQDEYDQAIQEVTRDRRKLDVELEQTVQMTLKKSENLDRITRIEADVKQMNREFYCETCDKQYKSVAEITAHLDSMDHGHMKRFKMMRSLTRKREDGQTDNQRDSKRQKEERRLAKEMEKRRQAAMPSQPLAVPSQQSAVAGLEDDSIKNSQQPTTATNTAAAPIKIGFSIGFKRK